MASKSNYAGNEWTGFIILSLTDSKCSSPDNAMDPDGKLNCQVMSFEMALGETRHKASVIGSAAQVSGHHVHVECSAHWLASICNSMHLLADIFNSAHWLASICNSMHLLAYIFNSAHWLASICNSMHLLADICNSVHWLASICNSLHLLADICNSVHWLASICKTQPWGRHTEYSMGTTHTGHSTRQII
jgi:hypothetical protein